MIGLEVCVDTFDGAVAVLNGGGIRVELCSALSEGDLTPSIGLMQAAAKLAIPSYAMIRPRAGLVCFSDVEADIMVQDIAAARSSGLAGVVLGAQTPDAKLDMELLSRLCDAAGDLSKTLHRVIDVVPEPLEALDQAVALGFERVLTSGGKPNACDGSSMIKQMVEQADAKLSVMPGCGLTPGNVAEVVATTGCTEVHAACQKAAPGERAFSDFDPIGGRFCTSELEVRLMNTALATIG